MTRKYQSNVADYELIWHNESPSGKAILVSRSEEDEPFWLPISQVEYERKKAPSKIVVVSIPDWLAEKHDLA